MAVTMDGLKYFTYEHGIEKNQQGGLKGFFEPRKSIIPADDPRTPSKFKPLMLIDMYMDLRSTCSINIDDFFVQTNKQTWKTG